MFFLFYIRKTFDAHFSSVSFKIRPRFCRKIAVLNGLLKHEVQTAAAKLTLH